MEIWNKAMKKIKPLKYDMKLQFTNYAKKMYPSFCWKYKFSLKIFFILVKLVNPRIIRPLVFHVSHLVNKYCKLIQIEAIVGVIVWKLGLQLTTCAISDYHH
jgi:hypothetical protein